MKKALHILLMLVLFATAASVSTAQIQQTGKVTKPTKTETTPKKSGGKKKSSSKASSTKPKAMTQAEKDRIIQNMVNNMVYVEGGTYSLGFQSNSQREYDDNPPHEMKLRSFYIGKYEVTQEEWLAVMGSLPDGCKYKGAKYPVTNLYSELNDEFFLKLNNITGKTFRCPNEAEWECAARGGKKSLNYRYAGSNDINKVAWYYSNAKGTTHQVGLKSPNELGLYDMSGNVEEIVDMSYYNTYYGYIRRRGGSWYDGDGSMCRLSHESAGDYSSWYGDHIGLRLALSAGETNPSPMVYTISVKGVPVKMIKVEGGEFMMGPTPDQGLNDYEKSKDKIQRVTLSSYCIAETEVTQELWKVVMGNNPSNNKGDSLPVEQVSWFDCQTFIKKLNEITGEQFRLPTEQEWEYAARGGIYSQGYYFAGGNALWEVAWYSSNSGVWNGSTHVYQSHAVATKKPNELGLYDMTGNVSEWCQDTGVSDTNTRVECGWGYSYLGDYKISHHFNSKATTKSKSVGFRLVMDL